MSETLLLTSLIFMIMFFKTPNPIGLCLFLILISFTMGVYSWLICSKWVAIGLILVFIGGMMISFLYVSSLAFNQKITFPSLPPVLIGISLTLFFSPLFFFNSPPLQITPLHTFTLNFSYLQMFLILYLLVTLFFVVKMMESFKGALAQKF